MRSRPRYRTVVSFALALTVTVGSRVIGEWTATTKPASNASSAPISPPHNLRAARGDREVVVQISICVPSSITRFVGILKKSIALAALRDIMMKSFSRQRAMPGLMVGIMVSRLKKYEVSS